jgi:hypothetical protein
VVIGRRDEAEGVRDERGYQHVPGNEDELRTSEGNVIVVDSESDDEEMERRR